jgi:hypothetical protein
MTDRLPVPPTDQPALHLLAVDAGLHTGLALYRHDGRLLWYRSHHLADQQKLKRLVVTLLRCTPVPTHIYLEGGGPLAELWQREALKLERVFVQLHAGQWREQLFYARQHPSGRVAKQQALKMAIEVIDHLSHKKPTGLRHDTAEAILIGLYGLLDLGWIAHWPPKKE